MNNPVEIITALGLTSKQFLSIFDKYDKVL